jgi:chromosome partitioning protein
VLDVVLCPVERGVAGEVRAAGAVQYEVCRPWIALAVDEVTVRIAFQPAEESAIVILEAHSFAWASSLDRQVRAFRVTTAFSTMAQRAAKQVYAEIVLVDVGPNLGAINRAAMVASDHVVVPLRPDLYSLQGLRNLGPTLNEWRQGWSDRIQRPPRAEMELPKGRMRPRGYVVLRHGTRVDRVVGAYDRWLRRVPAEYRRSVMEESSDYAPLAVNDDYCLGLIKHYHSLAPLGQEARKPVFLLRSADGAIGAHQQSVHDAYGHFRDLTERLLGVVGLELTV